MNIMDWLGKHSITDTLVLFWIFSALVNALPEPSADSHGFYKWLYTFVTAIAGHLHDAINQRQTQQSSVTSQGEKR